MKRVKNNNDSHHHDNVLIIGNLYEKEKMPICEIARRTKLSERTIIHYLNMGGFKPNIDIRNDF